MATYQELIAQKTALEQQSAALAQKIEEARRTERAGVLARIKAMRAGAGRKVAAKYRNSATGDTWSGRGLQPNWLKAALASGRKIEDFAV
jgi:DNA-binding protein H-NS